MSSVLNQIPIFREILTDNVSFETSGEVVQNAFPQASFDDKTRPGITFILGH